jgi:hypothetical protein
MFIGFTERCGADMDRCFYMLVLMKIEKYVMHCEQREESDQSNEVVEKRSCDFASLRLPTVYPPEKMLAYFYVAR